MVLNRSLLFLVCALVCFVILFLLAIDALSGGNSAAWLAAGLVFFTAAHLP